MNHIVKLTRGWLLVALILISATPALAFIQVAFAVRDAVGKSQAVFMAKIERLDPEKPGMVLTVVESLKGTPPAERLPINLTGDAKLNHTPQLLKRLATDLPLVVYYNAEEGKAAMLLAYTNGTWFQVLGHADGAQTRWAFTHCEIYLRRAYKGSTEELKQLTADIITGKSKGPDWNPKERPGMGAEIGS